MSHIDHALTLRKYRFSVRMKFVAIIFALVTALAPSCRSIPNPRGLPDFVVQHPTHPVLIIPGILGTRLKDPVDRRIVWGKAFDLSALSFHTSLLGKGKDGLELPIDSLKLTENRDHLVPDGIVDTFTILPHVLTVRVYGTLLKGLNACGYHSGQLHKCTASSNAYVFYYDWRRDNLEQVHLLHQRIMDLKAAYNNPHLKVDIVAHSMGCLIVYYYALYGEVDVLDAEQAPEPTYAGAANIRRIVWMAPPFHGSAKALDYLQNGYRVGVRKILKEALFTMPSVYQLLPDANPFLDENGRPVDADLYDPDSWTRLGLGFFSPEHQRKFIKECRLFYPDNWQEQSAVFEKKAVRFLSTVLHRAKIFHQALNHPAPNLPTLLIISDQHKTMDQVMMRREGKETRLIFNRRDTRKPGDRTVVRDSSFLKGADKWELVTVSSVHDRIPSDSVAMKNTIRFLSRE